MLLLRHGAKVSSRDGHGVTPLAIAAEHGNTEALDVLVQHGEHQDTLNSHQNPASHRAAFSPSSTRRRCERPGQQRRLGPVRRGWVGKRGQREAAASARGRPQRGQLRFPAAHPQSGIRGTHSVSPELCVRAKNKLKKCVNVCASGGKTGVAEVKSADKLTFRSSYPAVFSLSFQQRSFCFSLFSTAAPTTS